MLKVSLTNEMGQIHMPWQKGILDNYQDALGLVLLDSSVIARETHQF